MKYSLLFIFTLFALIMQKPDGLTTFGQSNRLNYIYLYIKVLTPANYGQYFPVKGGQGWLYHTTSHSKD